jgi:hypothetical protein
MSQTRFHNWQRAVDSFQENRRLLGVVSHGRYCGFDGITNIVGLTCDIAHVSGIVQTEADNISATNAKGVWVTRHGGVMQEDASIPGLTFAANPSADPRIDLVYGEHQWNGVLPGGQAAIYGVITGTAATTPVVPTVADPLIQVALCGIRIPAGATDLSGASVVLIATPELGNQDFIANHAYLDDYFARLNFYNRFTKMNSFANGSVASFAGNSVTLNADGNSFDGGAWAGGATVHRINTQATGTVFTIRNSHATLNIDIFLNQATAAGFSNVQCPRYALMAGTSHFLIPAGGSAILWQATATEIYIIGYSDSIAGHVQALYTQVNTLTASIAALVALPIGGIIMWSGNFSNFDVDGKGTNPGPMKNWAICNGNNATPDLRGRFVVGAISGVPDTGAAALATGIDPTVAYQGSLPPNYAMGDATIGSAIGQGEPHHKLVTAELPAHHHSIDAAAGNGTGANVPLGMGDGYSGGTGGVVTGDTGSGTAHSNLPPYFAIAYLMRTS